MSATTTGDLPDPDVLRQIGLALAAAGAPGWTSVSLVMFYEAPDVYEVRAWTSTSGGRASIDPPPVFFQLAKLRSAQVAGGQEPWQRCDLEVTCAGAGTEAELSIIFSDEVGDVPE